MVSRQEIAEEDERHQRLTLITQKARDEARAFNPSD
jgi:hypothetical protein